MIMSRHYIAETLLNVTFNYNKQKQTVFDLLWVEQSNIYGSHCLAGFYRCGSHFLCPPPRASSIRIICLSVCLFIVPSHLHTKCNILSYGDDTVTKLGV